MASVGFGTVKPAVAPPGGRRLSRRPVPTSSTVRAPTATKVVSAAAAAEGKGLFDAIFGALYKEEQLLETDPILNKVEGKATTAASAPKVAPKKAPAAASDGGGFNFGGLFSKKG